MNNMIPTKERAGNHLRSHEMEQEACAATDRPVSRKEPGFIFLASVAITMLSLGAVDSAHAKSNKNSLTFVPGALNETAEYQPWGVEIEGDCYKGFAQVDAFSKKDVRQGTEIANLDPTAMDPGFATTGIACRSGKVISLQMAWATGGDPLKSARPAHDLLEQRHRSEYRCRTPSGDVTYARFSHGNLVIEFRVETIVNRYFVRYSTTAFEGPLATPLSMVSQKGHDITGRDVTQTCSVVAR